MASDVAQTQRLRFFDQDAQHAPSAGQVADRAAGRLIDAGGEELGELRAAVVEHPDRCVASAGELTRGLEHAVENRREVELGDERSPDIEQTADAQIL